MKKLCEYMQVQEAEDQVEDIVESLAKEGKHSPK